MSAICTDSQWPVVADIARVKAAPVCYESAPSGPPPTNSSPTSTSPSSASPQNPSTPPHFQARSAGFSSSSPNPEAPSPENQSIETPRSPSSPQNEATTAGGEAVSMNIHPTSTLRQLRAQAVLPLPVFGAFRRTPERRLSRRGATLSALPKTLSRA
jgi:hypothetical protein